MLPEFAAELVKRQNVVMGTEDPDNPRDVEYLCGVEAWGDDIDHVEQSDAVERLDRSLLPDDAQKVTSLKSNRLTNKQQRRNKFTDEKLYNPGGIELGSAHRG